MLRAVFFGTPAFAVPSLEALLGGAAKVALVVTRPDKPVGRHSRPVASPVAQRASAAGVPAEKPERLRDGVLADRMRAAQPDVGVVVAYGRILPTELLEVPRLGFINVHASLLPRHRGAAPVAAAILAGDSETGVVTMRVVPELDAGPLYLERRAPIGERETAGSLSARLAVDGASLLSETLRRLEAGELSAREQSGMPTWAPPLHRRDGEADWTLPAVQIERRLRAFTPWPGLHTHLAGERVKLLELDLAASAAPREPGALWLEGGEARVAAGGGTSLAVRRVQRAGREPVTGAEFLRGLPGGTQRFDPAGRPAARASTGR